MGYMELAAADREGRVGGGGGVHGKKKEMGKQNNDSPQKTHSSILIM